jgi:hypothetical protein
VKLEEVWLPLIPELSSSQTESWPSLLPKVLSDRHLKEVLQVLQLQEPSVLELPFVVAVEAFAVVVAAAEEPGLEEVFEAGLSRKQPSFRDRSLTETETKARKKWQEDLLLFQKHQQSVPC